ncbi:MAG: redoxin domain-containing protein [Planctomycetota bacterium]
MNPSYARLTLPALLMLAAGTATPALAANGDPVEVAQNPMSERDARAFLASYEPAGAELAVGDDAPAFKPDGWIQGTEIESLEDGEVYVVEMWATWCGPCIRMIPHLHDLSEQYDGRATIIGTNIWERGPGMDALDTRTENIAEFVQRQPQMTYPIALDVSGNIAQDWMRAAGRSGIPSAFIVDRDGKVAWMGHPAGMDAALDAIVEGAWDTEAEAAKAIREAAEMVRTDPSTAFREVASLFESGEHATARALGEAVSITAGDEGRRRFAGAIAGLALDAALADEAAKAINMTFAERMADGACELSNWSDFRSMMTLSMVHWHTARPESAAKIMTQAIEVAADDPRMSRAQALNRVAWSLVEEETPISKEATAFALTQATAANILTNGEKASVVDTLARAMWHSGKKTEAIELQEKAVELATDEEKAARQETLNWYHSQLKTN